MPPKKISIVIPNHNALITLRACIESIFELTTYPRWELIVVDDGSSDGSREYLESLKNIKIISQTQPPDYQMPVWLEPNWSTPTTVSFRSGAVS